MDKFIESCHSILKKICAWTIDYYYTKIPPGLERRIRGDNGEMIFPTQDNMSIYQQKNVQPYWSNEDIAGKFDFTWKGTSLTSSQSYKIQVANDLMERYLPHQMIAGNMLATWQILKDGLIARNKKDWQNYLPPKEAIIAEMQRMEMEAQAQNVLGQQEGQFPQQVIEKAQAMGVPPEATMQMMNQRQGGQNAQPI
jgi:hypothetical protein